MAASVDNADSDHVPFHDHNDGDDDDDDFLITIPKQLYVFAGGAAAVCDLHVVVTVVSFSIGITAVMVTGAVATIATFMVAASSSAT